MSYTSLELGGRTRGLKFNQHAVITMSKYLDYDNMSATYGYALIYAGLSANCYVKREEVDFTFEQVCDWVDELKTEDVLKVQEVFQSTQAFQNIIKTNEEQPKKKKKTIKQT
jgi:hypothetical protein